jgi:hypothetical protein
MDDEKTNQYDEGDVKLIIDHPLMKTVYAINYDANKRRFYSIIIINKLNVCLNRSSLCC